MYIITYMLRMWIHATEQAKTSTSNPDICEAMTASRESGSCFIDNLSLSIVCIHSYY